MNAHLENHRAKHPLAQAIGTVLGMLIAVAVFRFLDPVWSSAFDWLGLFVSVALAGWAGALIGRKAMSAHHKRHQSHVHGGA